MLPPYLDEPQAPSLLISQNQPVLAASLQNPKTSLILEERRKEQAAAVFPLKSASQPVRPNRFNILPKDSNEILDLLRSSCSTTKTFKLPLRLGKGVTCFRTPPKEIATPLLNFPPTRSRFYFLPRDSHEILDLLRSSCSRIKTFKLPLRLGKGVVCFRTPPNLIATPPGHSLPTGCAFQSIMIWGSDLV